MTKYIGPKTDGENVATQADKLSLSSDTPDALTPDQSGAAGTAVTAARADHQHEILAASAGTITGSNAEGSSTSFARADHNHDMSITPSWTAPSLTNSWENFGSGFQNAGYYKDKFGFVHLRGLVKSGTIGAAIFTLPAGSRPANRHVFATDSNGSHARLDVYADGKVQAESGSNNWVSLSGIYFPAA